ncbi:MAG: isoprenyl transferase [Nitrospirota bacterium]
MKIPEMSTLEKLDEKQLFSLIDPKQLPKHLAIIMDGNGRWAAKRHLPRIAGHREGISTVREIVTTSRELGIQFLTLYAFSSENWNRPTMEVSQLMRLLAMYLKKELGTLMKDGVRLMAIGQTDKLPKPVLELLSLVSEKTRYNDKMTLILALSYSGRSELVDATRAICADLQSRKISIEDLSEESFQSYLYTSQMPDPDLMIRTSGEIRISNFFLWQMAYTELYFTKTLWPDFGRKALLDALLDYQNRERRFGKVFPNKPPRKKT